MLGVPRTATQKEIKKAYYQARPTAGLQGGPRPLSYGKGQTHLWDPRVWRRRGSGEVAVGKFSPSVLGISSKAWFVGAVSSGLLPGGPGIAGRLQSSFCSWDDNGKQRILVP